MKRIAALLLAALMLVSFAACSGKGASKETTTSNNETTSEQSTQANEAAAVDISGWNWVDGELDCYGYDDCYLSFKYPEQFNTSSDDSSGLQTRNYYFNPSDSTANANSSPYGIYVNFGQGSFGGATKATLEETIPGGLQERELGGRTVLFGEAEPDPNTGAHAFVYYTSYSDDEWARIWIILCDPEADGAFRKAFEESMSFQK